MRVGLRRLTLIPPNRAGGLTVSAQAVQLLLMMLLGGTIPAAAAEPGGWGRAPVEFVGLGMSPNPTVTSGTPVGGSPIQARSLPELTDALSLGDPLYQGHAVSRPAAVTPGPHDLSPASFDSVAWPTTPASPAAWFDPPPPTPCDSGVYDWHCLPDGLLYRSYLAGEKEPRFASVFMTDQTGMSVWEVALGGRVGLLRYGTFGTPHPQGFQFDIEGAALVRLNPDINTDVEATDYRFGILGTWREGPWSAKAGYYHISSHLGDEFLLRNPGYLRLNYVRDSVIAGLSYDVTPAVRVYGEAAYAIGHQAGAEPLEFQYGIEYSSTQTSWWAPFAGINGHTREDYNWETSINIVGGMQFLGPISQRRFRLGVQYYEGPALQYSFGNRHERLVGTGLWFDY